MVIAHNEVIANNKRFNALTGKKGAEALTTNQSIVFLRLN